MQDSLAAGGLRHGGELVIDGQGSFNTPLAVYLVSEACTSTHGIYSQNSGRYAKVRILAADGWVAPMGANPPSVEDVAAHWDRITDGSVAHEPLTVYDEFTAVAKAARGQGLL